MKLDNVVCCTFLALSSQELIYFNYQFFHRRPIQQLFFFPVGFSSLTKLVLWVLKLLLSPGLGSWQLEFKSLIIVIVGFQNFVCCLAWAVGLGVQIADERRSLYIGSLCPAMKSLSRYLEEAAFSISISSSVFIFCLFLFSIALFLWIWKMRI